MYGSGPPSLTDPEFFHPPAALNKKMKRKRVSASTILLLLFGAAISIVLYIGNIIAVDHLLSDINRLETRLNRIKADQEILRAQINRMSSLDRIQQRAETELGLKSLHDPPAWVAVDEEKIRQVEQSLVKK